jgi:ABC-2 type transport system ATP-binding protein
VATTKGQKTTLLLIITTMSMIATFELTRHFGNLIAVDDLTLAVDEGEVIGLLGPNGAGKTTTISMLTGMIKPTSGYATVSGLRTDQRVEQLHEIIGLLPEIPGFYDRFSGKRNLEYFAGFYPLTDYRSQVEKYLKLIGLWERRHDKVGTYSKGMKHRLAIARALLHEPKVLFFDEPTVGLDPEAAKEVRDLISKLREAGRTIFLSTHNLGEAELLCDRVAIINTKLLAIDTTNQLRHRFFRRQIMVQLESFDAKLVEIVSNLSFVKEMRCEDNRLFLQLTDPEHNRSELVRIIVEAGGRIVEVSEQQYPLEEVYMKLIREADRES